MRNGDEALVQTWVALPDHPGGGHWIGMVNPMIQVNAYPGESIRSRSPFNSWTAEGKDCDGYSAWDIVVQEDKA